MSLVKIDEQGWDSFSGDLGGINFVDGVSEREPTAVEATRIGASVRLVDVDTGKQLGGAAELVGSRFDSIVSEDHEIGLIEDALIDSIVADAEITGKVYTREELEGIADTGGIAAIRELVKGIDSEGKLKGNSIQKLIEGIISHQSFGKE